MLAPWSPIKRPVPDIDGRQTVGFKPETYATALRRAAAGVINQRLMPIY